VRAREALHERGEDPASFDAGRHGAANVHQAVQRRLGIKLADRVEHLLAAAHPGEPIVDERDFRRSHQPASTWL
jgi:hypothetical protein